MIVLGMNHNRNRNNNLIGHSTSNSHDGGDNTSITNDSNTSSTNNSNSNNSNSNSNSNNSNSNSNRNSNRDSSYDNGDDSGINGDGDGDGNGDSTDNNEASINDEIPLKHGCNDTWTWSKRYRSLEVVLFGTNDRTVYFHPNWSKGTAGVRGERPLNNGRFYWELHLSRRVFGTSIMFGIGTKYAELHSNVFTNMLGMDKNGWGLSHKGLIWHRGFALVYTKRFTENQPASVGLLFDGIEGTLTYYKDGKCLGVAFRDLDKVKEQLYPIVCSTAAKTEITLICARRDFVNLQDRCRAEIIKHVKNRNDLKELKLPKNITNYLTEGYSEKKPFKKAR